MDVTFALALPLIAGYLYVTTCKQLKFQQAREDGHRLYFRIAYFGLLLFLLAAFAVGCVNAAWGESESFQQVRRLVVDLVRPLLKEPKGAAAQIAFLLICLLSVALGYVLPRLDNFVFKGGFQQAALAAADTDHLEKLLLEAAIQYKSVAITITSGKVYVGLVLQTAEPETNRRVIAILPMMSGYRDDTGKVTFTTFYDQIYADRAKARDDDESNDFRLILPIDKMVSVAFFDVETYAKFNAQAPAKPRRIKVHSPRRQ